MTVAVGVIGAGMMGTTHIENLAGSVAGARVAAIYDLDPGRARDLAVRVGAATTAGAEELVRRDDVEAVLVASPGPTHADIVIDAISAGKPILCEKPIATTLGDAARVIDAEISGGRRLVQVGFMRRFDPGYLEVEAAIDSGTIGDPLMAHMLHRNAEVPPGFDDVMVVNESLVHEVDVARWLLRSEIAGVRMLAGKTASNAAPGLRDPKMMILDMASGTLVFVESFVTNGFAYDVRCEIVGTGGTAELTTPRLSRITRAGAVSEPIGLGWRERFQDAYRLEVQAWIDSLHDGRTTGATAWDGYAAAATTSAAVEALGRDGTRVAVSMPDRPSLYA